MIIESFCARGILRVKSHIYFFFYTGKQIFVYLGHNNFFPLLFKDVNE